MPGPSSKDFAKFLEEGGEPEDVSQSLAKARDLLEKGEATPETLALLPEALQVALVERAARRGQAALISDAAASLNKEVAKAARRALHHLRSRGVAVQEPKQKAPQKAAPRAEEGLPSYSSHIDARGQRIVFFLRRVPLEGYDLFQG